MRVHGLKTKQSRTNISGSIKQVKFYTLDLIFMQNLWKLRQRSDDRGPLAIEAQASSTKTFTLFQKAALKDHPTNYIFVLTQHKGAAVSSTPVRGESRIQRLSGWNASFSWHSLQRQSHILKTNCFRSSFEKNFLLYACFWHIMLPHTDLLKVIHTHVNPWHVRLADKISANTAG